MFKIFIYFLILCFSSLSNIDASNPSAEELHIEYGGRALDALRRLLNFFESDAMNLNLDGLYGLRIAQGQLIALVQQDNILDENQIISSLIEQIQRIANVTLKQLEHDAPAYLHRFSLVSYQPFLAEYQAKKIKKQLIETGERSADFNEEESDRCFGELLGNFHELNLFSCHVFAF